MLESIVDELSADDLVFLGSLNEARVTPVGDLTRRPFPIISSADGVSNESAS